ncbi:hypothetical protein M422DRAFT_29249 [Sphaerobolus stellatus SS14]|nr:hypothetical protein M422DRAFT_29249 [Sphaerobolus stellatus SS14]
MSEWPELNIGEFFWQDIQPFLEKRGYILRPRYHPGWVGSWKTTGKKIRYCEDSIPIRHPNVLDARRLSDDLHVALKVVSTGRNEISIVQYLSSKDDPRNRAVPILDIIPLPGDDNQALLVMPFLRPFDTPAFSSALECIELIHQLLQGMEFFHEHNITHMDACRGNIMMDASRLIPEGFHPANIFTNEPEGIGHILRHRKRSEVSPLLYYFVDFGLSCQFPSFVSRKMLRGKAGQDKSVPEFSKEKPYDPFRVDIYQLGGVFQTLIDDYDVMEWLKPLVDVMRNSDPLKRPNATQALLQLEDLICSEAFT